ncbi:transport-associated protein [Salinisphaera sp. C84B14]|uniref:BON domain-containing protein n=1 Tax=Salinisphaera sp. C84B14 TaxID=1304155 RepID=UPI0032B1F9AF
MNNAKTRFATVLTSLVLGASLLAGCSETPQEKYDNAVEKLAEARESRNEAQEALNDKKEELKELQANLNESETELQQARQKVAAASEAVNKTVNDQVLFRTIQRDVLKEKSFDKSAISVGVKDRVVTLTGVVPDEETRELALEKARSQAGVEDVIDELQLEDEQGEPRAPSAGSVAKPNQNAPAQQDKPAQPQGNQPQQPKDQPQAKPEPQQPEADAQGDTQGNTQGDTPKPPMAPNDGGGSASATQAGAYGATA